MCRRPEVAGGGCTGFRGVDAAQEELASKAGGNRLDRCYIQNDTYSRSVTGGAQRYGTIFGPAPISEQLPGGPDITNVV
jgi:hypothetical protein